MTFSPSETNYLPDQKLIAKARQLRKASCENSGHLVTEGYFIFYEGWAPSCLGPAEVSYYRELLNDAQSKEEVEDILHQEIADREWPDSWRNEVIWEWHNSKLQNFKVTSWVILPCEHPDAKF